MTADVIDLARYRPFAPRVVHAWKPAAGGIADYCGARVEVVTVGYCWTVVDYSDGDGKWRKDVRTQLLRPWRGEDMTPCA